MATQNREEQKEEGEEEGTSEWLASWVRNLLGFARQSSIPAASTQISARPTTLATNARLIPTVGPPTQGGFRMGRAGCARQKCPGIHEAFPVMGAKFYIAHLVS